MPVRALFSSIRLLCTMSLLLVAPLMQSPMFAVGQAPTSPITDVNTTIPPFTPLWTTWGAVQYTLADDGSSLWIGATGGVVRWDKQTSTYRRYTAVDGLPHTQVLAIAVDATGNRWFGGDGGLSRLDTHDQWTHFTTANSGLHTNNVDAIAVTANDTLYLSHGLPDGSVSCRQSDGSWRWFPNRESAIQADYALIQQTRNRTPLWTVVGSELWSGYHVFDGAHWQDRTPPDVTTAPLDMVTDSHQHLWVLANTATLYAWDGVGWKKHYANGATALAIDAQDTLWLGGQGIRQLPYDPLTATLSSLGSTTPTYFTVAGPVQTLLITAEGLWGIGPGWLLLPNQTITVFADEPRFKGVSDALVESNGKVWLYSGYYGGPSIGTVQTFIDNGTAFLRDDQWQVVPVDYRPNLGNCELVAAFEYAPDGDVWYAQYCQWRAPSPVTLVRYHGQDRIEYALPPLQLVRDIFAADAHHLWFAVSTYSGEWRQGVLSLDDQGTPLDTSDDQWQTYPVTTKESQTAAVAAAGGQLWYGDQSGLYHYTGSTWEPVQQSDSICDLTLAADGTLYARVSSYFGTNCQPAAENILVVRPDGKIQIVDSVKAVVQAEPDRVRTATRRNALWTVAPDGAIWYLAPASEGQTLQRYQANQIQPYPLPDFHSAVQRLAVDIHQHVWLVADDQLWRMSPPPDFTLTAPATWLLAPARSRQGPITLRSSEGYSSTVTLTVVDAPAALSVTIEPNPLPVDQVAQMTLTAAPASLPTTYQLLLQASDHVLTHTVTLTITVAAELHDLYLPAIAQ